MEVRKRNTFGCAVSGRHGVRSAELEGRQAGRLSRLSRTKSMKFWTTGRQFAL